MEASEQPPGAPATETGAYEELNVFGTPTGKTAVVAAGEALPDSPRGFSWRPLSTYAAPELRARAADCRRLAANARTAAVAESLRTLADRFDALADQRAREGGSPA